MNRRKFATALLGLALAPAGACPLPPRPARAASAQEEEPAPTPQPSRDFQEARAVRTGAAPGPEAFEFEMGGFSYHVKQNSNGWRKKGERVRRFNLRPDDGRLERVYYHDYGGRLLLVCELNHGGEGSGFVTLLEQPSMRALWKQALPAFNVGEPLREGRGLYVTGIGFVGRLDLGTGEFDWKHADLYDWKREGAPKHFESFEAPVLDGDAVLFRDRSVYNSHETKTLVVNKKTGKIIRVE